MLTTYTIFIDFQRITFKASFEISASSLKDFLTNVEKVQKMHKLSIIMHPSWNSFLENIFDLQVTIDRVHPVGILSLSDYCITTDIMWQTPKTQKKTFEAKE